MKSGKLKSLASVFASNLLILIFACSFGCSQIQKYISEGDNDISGNGDIDAELYPVAIMSAEEYYSQYGKMINILDVGNSKEVHSEKETFLNLTARGFTQYPITTETSMGGELIDELEVSDQVQTQHPMYITYYITESGNLWTIMEINGHVFANPAFYNLTENGAGQVILSETNSIFSYDPISNAFYETIPNVSALKLIVVDHIDADTLEKMTAEELHQNA